MHKLQHQTGLLEKKTASCFVRVGAHAEEVWRAIRLVNDFVRRDIQDMEQLRDYRLNVVLGFADGAQEQAGTEFAKRMSWSGDVRYFTSQGKQRPH